MKVLGAVLALSAALTATASQAQEFDLREFFVGMNAAEFPRSGYHDITCVDAPAIKSDGWEVWRECPGRSDGVRVIRMAFDTPDDPRVAIRPSARGTRVGGLPVEAHLLLDNGGRLVEINLSPQLDGAPPFVAKRANMLALEAKSRFGEEGWTCTQSAPDAARVPIGSVFIDEHCEKQTAQRRIIVERRLYRNANSGGVVSDANVRIRLTSG